MALVVLTAIAVVTACRARDQATATRRVVDGLGREVQMPASPRRIVSLAPSVTATVIALGLGEQLVGVTNFCTVPPELERVARIGGMLNPSLEAVRALRPDLLLATSSGNDPALGSQARALGLPLYTVHTPDVEGTLRAIEGLAGALGEAARGRALSARLSARLQAVRDRIRGRPLPRVLFLVWGDPLVAPGRGAFLTDTLARSGAESVTSDAQGSWPAFSLESLIARAPQVILTTRKNAATLDRLRRDPAWAGVPAVRLDRLYLVEEAIEQPGPEMVDGIEEVARLLHPEAGGGTSTIPGPSRQ